MNRYQPTWSSLATHPTPRWFLDAKFGIYTHWGPYSVAAYGSNGTWYPKQMYDPERPEYRYHSETFGPPEQVGYKELIRRFTAAKFDADEWAELFAASGARFAGPVAEHHDGFSMWDSRINGWNAARMGPKRDVTGELAAAIRSRGMKFAATFHHAQNWYMFPTDDRRYDCSDARYRDLYTGPHAADARPDDWFLDRWEGKLYEVVDGYRPDLIWFDFGLGFIREQHRKRFLAYYYNKEREWGSGVVVTFKEIPKGWFNLPPMTGVADLELGRMWELTNHVWLTDTTVDAQGVWSYVKDAGFKSVERLVHNLVDRVSKNGHLLLNVGPRPDGTIPEQAADCLRGMGRWLEINGEAIYGTTPWVSFGEGPTQREGERPLHREERAALHGRGYPLHDQGRRGVRDLSRPPRRRHHHQGVAPVLRGRGGRRHRARRSGRPEVAPHRRGHDHRGAAPPARRARLHLQGATRAGDLNRRPATVR